MRPIHVADSLRLVFLLGAVACAEAGTEPLGAGLTGNFERIPSADPRGPYIAFSLREAGGTITGTGYLPSQYLPSAVTGTRQDGQVTLQIPPGAHTVSVRFTGRLERNSLAGRMEFGDFGEFPIELVRVDTVATADASIVLSGAIIRTETTRCAFTYETLGRTVGLLIESMASPPRMTIFISWEGLHYPLPGSYQLGPGLRPSTTVYEMPGGPGSRTLRVENGQVVVDIARRGVLIGHFSFTASDPEASGGLVSVTGTFSAPCEGPYC